MVINLNEYLRCDDCGSIVKRVSVDGADLYRCRCGSASLYFADLDYRIDTDSIDDLTVAEWRGIAIDNMIDFTPSRWMYLRMAWENLKAFIRGK